MGFVEKNRSGNFDERKGFPDGIPTRRRFQGFLRALRRQCIDENVLKTTPRPLGIFYLAKTEK